MGLIDGFEYDIFISYAHDDNLDHLVKEPAEGWVLDFAKALKKGLSVQLRREIESTGRNLEVFWDKSRLQKGEPLDWALNEHVDKSAIFCIFMSQNYLDSDWCKQELDWFIKTLENRQDSLSRDRAGGVWPVIVVSVGPTVQAAWPNEVLKRGMPFEFFDKNEHTGDPRHAYPSIAVTPDPNFFQEFTKLETSISKRIKKALTKEMVSAFAYDPEADDVTPATPVASDDAQPSAGGGASIVLLATADMAKKAKRLQEQCAEAGMEVACPSLDMNGSDPAAQLAPVLSGAKAVVLMLGVFPGADEEVVAEAMRAASDQADKRCLVWMQKGLKPSLIDVDFEHYSKFVKSVQKSILTSDLDGLKGEVEKRIKASDKPAGGGDFQRRVKLFIDAAKIDYDIAQQIREKLHKNKVNVRAYLPQADADQKTHNEQWNNIVEKCDGIILVYGRIDIDAIDEKLDQIWRLSAKRKSKSKSEISVAIIDAPPPSGYDVAEPGIQVITAQDDIDLAEIVDFISGLQNDAESGAAA